MACCTEQREAQRPQKTTSEALAGIPESTWCCMGRMAYELARAVTDAQEPDWFEMPIQAREAWAQMLRRALVQSEMPVATFDVAVVRAAQIMVNAA